MSVPHVPRKKEALGRSCQGPSHTPAWTSSSGQPGKAPNSRRPSPQEARWCGSSLGSRGTGRGQASHSSTANLGRDQDGGKLRELSEAISSRQSGAGATSAGRAEDYTRERGSTIWCRTPRDTHHGKQWHPGCSKPCCPSAMGLTQTLSPDLATSS